MKKDISENAPKKNKKGQKKKISVISIIVIVLAACVFCLAAYKLITIYTSYKASDTSYDKIRDILQSSDQNSTGQNSSTDLDSSGEDDQISGGEDYDHDELLPVEYEDAYDEGMTWNLSALRAINSDVVGYIKARGDGNIVDYPIVQGTDNDYYLDHMVDCTYNAAGSIFMDYSLKYGFSSPYCIIYGHNMAYGSRMFGYLKQYDNTPSYYSGHTEYDIYAGEKHYVYKVFAIYIAETSGLTYSSPLLYSFENMTEEQRESYLREFASFALSQSQVDTGYTVDDVNSSSHLITLSTCYGDYSNPYRYVVVLIRDRIVLSK